MIRAQKRDEAYLEPVFALVYMGFVLRVIAGVLLPNVGRNQQKPFSYHCEP